jgi:hypothetical protein
LAELIEIQYEKYAHTNNSTVPFLILYQQKYQRLTLEYLEAGKM